MKRTIFCTDLQCITEGQDFLTYHGKLETDIWENISKKLWYKWMKKQTMIINKKKLNMIKKKDRVLLEEEMIHFLF